MLERIEYLLKQKESKSIVILLAIVSYYFYTYGNYDFPVSDEDVYLASGLNLKLPMDHFVNLLYPLGIKLLSNIIINPLTLLYTYYFLLSIAVFYALIAFLTNITGRFWDSFFISVCYLFSSFQISLTPRITILNLFIGLILLSRINKNRPNYINWGILTSALLLCNFVSRPEFFWFFVISFVIFSITVFFNSAEIKIKKMTYWLIMVFIIGLLYYMGGGINEPGKLKIAFIQHFFDNYQSWYGENFHYDEEFLVFEKIYGKVNSDFDLIRVNPGMFFRHIFSNFLNYFTVIIKIIKSTFYDMFVTFFKAKTYIYFGIVLLFFFTIIKWKNTLSGFWRDLVNYSTISQFLLMFLLPTIVSVLVVYPRDHYVILHLPLYFLLFSFFLKNLEFRSEFLKKNLKVIVPFVLIGGIYSLFPYPKMEKSNANFYRFIKNKSIENDLHFLSNDIFGYNYYAGKIKISVWNPRTQNLTELINSKEYNGIIMQRLDLEVEENRYFLKEGYKKTNLVRINKFESINRYIWVKPELAARFSTQ